MKKKKNDVKSKMIKISGKRKLLKTVISISLAYVIHWFVVHVELCVYLLASFHILNE